MADPLPSPSGSTCHTCHRKGKTSCSFRGCPAQGWCALGFGGDASRSDHPALLRLPSYQLLGCKHGAGCGPSKRGCPWHHGAALSSPTLCRTGAVAAPLSAPSFSKRDGRVGRAKLRRQSPTDGCGCLLPCLFPPSSRPPHAVISPPCTQPVRPAFWHAGGAGAGDRQQRLRAPVYRVMGSHRCPQGLSLSPHPGVSHCPHQLRQPRGSWGSGEPETHRVGGH